MALVLNEFGIRGRVGNVVFCKLNGKSYMRSLPDRIDPNTPKQQEVRSRFRVAVRFYKKIKETSLKGILDLSADKICSSVGGLAEDLHAVGCAVGFGFEQADRFVVVVDQRPAGHHLADRKSCAVLGHQPTAGRVRKARHRAKNCPVGQGDISDFQRIHLIPRFA